MRTLLLPIALALSFLGCSKCPNRHEASRILLHFDRLIAAPNDQKAGPLRDLEASPCSAEVICQARDQCSSAFGHLVRGMAMERKVHAAIEEMEREGGSQEMIDALEAELDGAERELNAAKAAIPECERAASDLRRVCG